MREAARENDCGGGERPPSRLWKLGGQHDGMAKLDGRVAARFAITLHPSRPGRL